MRCGNYAERPRICRIYPLEARPFIDLRPESKLCPPEAWAPQFPVLERDGKIARSEEHTSELQSLMRISYAVFCLKKKRKHIITPSKHTTPPHSSNTTTS